MEGWLMKLIGHVARAHDKRSAVTSLAGQDVIIGSCTRLERREMADQSKTKFVESCKHVRG